MGLFCRAKMSSHWFLADGSAFFGRVEGSRTDAIRQVCPLPFNSKVQIEVSAINHMRHDVTDGTEEVEPLQQPAPPQGASDKTSDSMPIPMLSSASPGNSPEPPAVHGPLPGDDKQAPAWLMGLSGFLGDLSCGMPRAL